MQQGAEGDEGAVDGFGIGGCAGQGCGGVEEGEAAVCWGEGELVFCFPWGV